MTTIKVTLNLNIKKDVSHQSSQWFLVSAADLSKMLSKLVEQPQSLCYLLMTLVIDIPVNYVELKLKKCQWDF